MMLTVTAFKICFGELHCKKNWFMNKIIFNKHFSVKYKEILHKHNKFRIKI
jgi:hypothetical protein